MLLPMSSAAGTRGARETQSLHGELASAETSIAVSADEHAPRLLTLKLVARAGPGAQNRATQWLNRAQETLPDHVEVNGTSQPVLWRLDRAASRFEPKQIDAVYVADSQQLKLIWQWRARREQGPIEHSLTIENQSSKEVWLPLLPSFRFDWQIDPNAALERFWVEKGADTPSDEGTHLDAFKDGDTWRGSSSTYARPIANQPREMIPYVLVDAPDGGRPGWYLGIEFSGRTHTRLQPFRERKHARALEAFLRSEHCSDARENACIASAQRRARCSWSCCSMGAENMMATASPVMRSSVPSCSKAMAIMRSR